MDAISPEKQTALAWVANLPPRMSQIQYAPRPALER
jgi:hypothetical protein